MPHVLWQQHSASNMDGHWGMCPQETASRSNFSDRLDGASTLFPPSYNPINSFFSPAAQSYGLDTQTSSPPFNGNLNPVSWEPQSHQYLPPLPQPPNFNSNSLQSTVTHDPLSAGNRENSALTNVDLNRALSSDDVRSPPAAISITSETTASITQNASLEDNTLKEGSWAGRNPSRPIIPLRPRRPTSSNTGESLGEEQSRQTAHAVRAERRKALEDTIQEYVDEQTLKLNAIAEMYSISKDYVLNLVGVVSSRQPTRRPQLQNALIHAKAKEVNADLPEGKRYSLSQIREMVTQDPVMQNLTDDQKQKYISELADFRETKTRGVRANNSAAARDVSLTADRLAKELDALAMRTGIYASFFITRGHVNDSVQSTWHGTDNSAVFWEDVFKHSALDIARQYEQWACAQGQNLEERDSLANMRKQATAYISNGLKVTLGKQNVAMNYISYETAIIDTHGVKLVGWPAGIPFTNPSGIGTVGEMRKLRDALRSGGCHWKRLNRSEREAFSAELQSRRAAGEQVKKPRKRRSDAGKRRAVTGAEGRRKKSKAGNTPGTVQGTAGVEESDESSSDEGSAS